MANKMMGGVIAGAAGTVALDMTTYLDMVLRARPSSETPSTVVGLLAEKLGVTSLAPDHKDDKTANRRSGLGALLGYATGVGVGAAYGIVRGKNARSGLFSGVAAGLVAMAVGDIPIAATGASDPSSWSASDWASDLIPHIVYGIVLSRTYEVFSTI